MKIEHAFPGDAILGESALPDPVTIPTWEEFQILTAIVHAVMSSLPPGTLDAAAMDVVRRFPAEIVKAL